MASTISESDVYKSVYKRRSKLAFSSLITRYKPDNIMKVDTSVVVPAPLAKNVVFDVLNLVHNMIPGRSAPSLAKFYGASRGFKYHENIIAMLLSDPTIARIEAINPKQLAMPVALFGLEKNVKLIGQAEEIDELKLSNLLRDFVGEPDVQIIKVDAPHELDYVEPTSRIIVIVGAGVGPERIRAYTMAKFRNYHYYGYTGHSGISILVRD
ncbi:MAG: hypothetical protein JZD41_02325 [Thermoproteus sp.]|nr:hypothetical protein [Thermoproteus sp.]